MRVRYGSWSGTQDPFPADVDADAVMDEISEDLLNGLSPEEALERFLRRGQRGGFRGLDELRRRVAEARRRELGRMGLEDRMRAVEQRLAEIVERERTALHFSAADDAEARAHELDELDGLPAEVASRIAALEQHRWEDGRAEADFRALVDELRREVAEATFGRMAGALGSLSPEDLERMHDLMAELNGLIAARERGEDTSEAFTAFKERYGDLLGGLGGDGDPDTLDELLEELARRMAAMSQLLASMDPDQRRQLADMAAQLLGQDGLALQAEQLQRSLQGMFPELGWNQGVQGASPTGRESGSISQAVDWVEHLQEMEDLGTALGQRYPGARLEDVDPETLRRALGDESVRDLRALQEVERALEEAGALRRSGGRLELTPRGVRRLGERSLAKIYERAMTGGSGSHRTASAGGEGELTGATRAWRFGDPFRLDVGRTIANGILRSAAGRTSSSGAERGVRLAPEDFELAEAEQRVRAATVLLLDMSFSMPLRGNWAPAKRMALALQSLVSSKFPEDRFYVVGFSDYARRLQPADLLVTGWERVYGTNMQHAFMIARRLLGAHPTADKQVIMVTDGEPTAHLEGDTPWFNWPPEPKTLRLTLAEAARLSQAGATLNVFLLDHDPGAAAFVERMVSAVGGRIFYPDLADLGSLVVRDFLSRRAA